MTNSSGSDNMGVGKGFPALQTATGKSGLEEEETGRGGSGEEEVEGGGGKRGTLRAGRVGGVGGRRGAEGAGVPD